DRLPLGIEAHGCLAGAIAAREEFAAAAAPLEHHLAAGRTRDIGLFGFLGRGFALPLDRLFLDVFALGISRAAEELAEPAKPLLQRLAALRAFLGIAEQLGFGLQERLREG